MEENILRRLLAECTRPAQDQAKQNPRMEQRKWDQGPTPTQELFTIDRYCGKEKSILFKEVTMSLSPTAQERRHACD